MKLEISTGEYLPGKYYFDIHLDGQQIGSSLYTDDTYDTEGEAVYFAIMALLNGINGTNSGKIDEVRLCDKVKIR